MIATELQARLQRISVRGLILFGLISAGIAESQETRLGIEEVDRRVRRISERLFDFFEPSSIPATLVSDWAPEPRRRATLAIVLKTLRTLERELALRRNDNGAILDATIDQMLAWCENSLKRLGEKTFERRPSARQPDQRLPNQPFGVPAFVFVDEVLSTATHPVLGDMDVLTAMGQRFYCRLSSRWLDLPQAETGVAPDADSSLDDPQFAVPTVVHTQLSLDPRGVQARRLAALGMRQVSFEPALQPQSQEAAQVPLNTQFTECDLKDLLTMQIAERGMTALALRDSSGEPRSAAIARRALIRGVSRQRHFAMTGWRAICETDDPRSIAASMWIDAIEGLRFGLIRGWRDLRDGRPSSAPCLFTKPWVLETIAHTAMDLAEAEQILARIDIPSRLLIAIPPEAIDESEPNEWSPWVLAVFDELFRRGIAYDLCPIEQCPADAKLFVSLTKQDVIAPAEFLAHIAGMLEKTSLRNALRIHSDQGPAGVARLYTRALKPDGRTLAVINLSQQTQSLQLESDKDLIIKDLLESSGTLSNEAVRMSPWQVRILRW